MDYHLLLVLASFYNTLGNEFEKYIIVRNKTLNAFSDTIYSNLFIACIYGCDKSTACLSVSYNEPSLTCYFHDEHPVQTDVNVTVSAGYTLYYPYDCPTGLYRLKDKCYFYSTFLNSWADSQLYCNGIGGNLAKIESDDEQEFLAAISEEKYPENGHDFYWIGAYHNATQAKFLWYDDTNIEYSGGWGPSQPNINTGCVDIIRIYSWEWNDHIDCETELAFICEKDIVIK